MGYVTYEVLSKIKDTNFSIYDSPWFGNFQHLYLEYDRVLTSHYLQGRVLTMIKIHQQRGPHQP